MGEKVPKTDKRLKRRKTALIGYSVLDSKPGKITILTALKSFQRKEKYGYIYISVNTEDIKGADLKKGDLVKVTIERFKPD